MAEALIHGRIATDGGLLDDHALLIEEGRIAAIVHEKDSKLEAARTYDLKGRMLLPGFIDTQVNGGGGVLFNDAPSLNTIRRMAAAHAKFGTTGFLPTLISDDLDVIARAIAAVSAALKDGIPGVLGIHLEGPFLSPARKGVHNETKFRTIDEEAFALLTSLSHGKTLVTLAPEMTTPEMIGRLARAGVIVAAGHTNATYEDTQAAFGHGLTGFTHLFNAMSPLTGRAPGVVGAALINRDAYCGIIVDGHHVHPDVLKLVLRTKPHDRFMLVTDAWANIGTDLTSFQLQGATIHIKDGVCVDERGVLAGSAMDMSRAVRNAMALLGVSLADALVMASTAPAAFLGLGRDYGKIAKGFRANLVAADDDLTVRATWIDGMRVFEAG
ncbi:MAG TPA: N-acetylglucosamine-6-phosphate deacetylase [Rhizomicrobium sp.]|nr:N-acetylglucosamine-6-phosphate deacetylase [Rhizomicrobium sp.]